MHRVRVAEMTAGDVAEKEHKLLYQGSIITELRPQLIADRVAHRVVADERKRIARSETDEKEADRRHQKDDDQRLQDAAGEVPPHSASAHRVVVASPTRSRSIRSLGG